MGARGAPKNATGAEINPTSSRWTMRLSRTRKTGPPLIPPKSRLKTTPGSGLSQVNLSNPGSRTMAWLVTSATLPAIHWNGKAVLILVFLATRLDTHRRTPNLLVSRVRVAMKAGACWNLRFRLLAVTKTFGTETVAISNASLRRQCDLLGRSWTRQTGTR